MSDVVRIASLLLLFYGCCPARHGEPPMVSASSLVVLPQEQLMTSEEKKVFAIGRWCVSQSFRVDLLNQVPITPNDKPARAIKALTKKPQKFTAGMKCDLSGYGWLEGIGYTDEHSLGQVVVRYWQSRERTQYTDCPNKITTMLDFGDFLRLCDPIKADHQREIGTRLREQEEKKTVEQAVKEQGRQ